MALERKVAIVDKYEPNLQRSQIDQDYYRAQGISIVGLLINIKTTPEEVVAFVERERPDLVILAENYAGHQEVLADLSKIKLVVDLGLSTTKLPPIQRGEGVEALARIRQSYPKLPVYVLSGNPQHREKAMAAGTTGYLDRIPLPEEMGTLLNKHYSNVQSQPRAT